MDAASISERMAAAARELQAADDFEDTLAAAVSLAVVNVKGTAAAGISIVQARRRVTIPAATDDMAVIAERLQRLTGEGPLLDVIGALDAVYSPDLRADTRWPTWGPRVSEETGARSVLSFRLFTTGDTLGALNLYSREIDGFDADDRSEGLAIAAHVAVALASAREADQLVALDSRTIIGQASGIMMERFGIDAQRAAALLSRLASQHQLKVREVATRVVLNQADVAAEDGGS